MRKKLFKLVFMLMISVAAITFSGIGNVSAQYPTPEIVVYPSFQTGVYPTFVEYEFAIRNAPHDDLEGVPPEQDSTSKTWAWQIEVHWNSSVLYLPSASYITEDASYPFLGYFEFYEWVWIIPDVLGEWQGPFDYARSGLTTVYNAATNPNKALISDGLKADPDPTTVELQPAGATPNPDPNVGWHLGAYYDLPYSEGLSVISGRPNELSLFKMKFVVMKDGPPYSSLISINLGNTYFWAHDVSATYVVSPQDAWFGVIGPHIHSMGSLIDLYAPVCTTWHGLYPADIYCNMYHLSDWKDNGDDYLSPCDFIVLTPTEPTGPPMWYHVEDVTITITVSLKPQQTEIMYIDYERDPRYPYDLPITEPVCTQWHELYPEYCKRYHLAAWEDTQAPTEPGYGELSESDQIVLVDKDTGVAADYHVDDVSTDIILKPEPDIPVVSEFPLGIGLIMALAPIIPIIYLWRRKGWKK